MAAQGYLHSWARAEGATLVILYQEEAHGEDEWLLSTARHAAPGKEDRPVMVKKHRSMADRRVAALTFAQDYAIAGAAEEAAPVLAAASAAAAAELGAGAVPAAALACSAGAGAPAPAAPAAAAAVAGEGEPIAIDAATGASVNIVEAGAAARAAAIARRRKEWSELMSRQSALGPVKVPLLLDSMGNDFLRTYASWPVRYYILAEDSTAPVGAVGAGAGAGAVVAAPPITVELIGEPDGASYDPWALVEAADAMADGSFFAPEARAQRLRAAPPRSAVGAVPAVIMMA